MRVSQRVDYALRAMTSLAMLPAGTQIAAGDIADQLELPRRFVEQQFTALARAGLVECRRGAGGGCALARPAEDLTVAEIVRALRGDVIDVPRTTGVAASEVWARVADRVEEELSTTTLAELARRQAEIEQSRAAMYYI